MFSNFSDQLWTLQQVDQKEVSGRKMGPPAASSAQFSNILSDEKSTTFQAAHVTSRHYC